MSNAEKHETDVVIIGAGPVGLFAVFECGMLGMSCHVIDSLESPGGQCAALYPEKPIYDIPAYPVLQAGVLVDNLLSQIAPFDPVYHLNQQAVFIKETPEGGWAVTTSAGVQISGKAVIIAAGVGAFGPNRPPLDNLEQYEGKSVFYMVGRREDLRGKKIVIAGGGDSAVDWAVSLAELAEKIYVVHRRDKFRAAPETVRQMHELAENSDKVEILTPYQLHALRGDGGMMEAVEIIDFDGNIKTLAADILLPFFGLASKIGPIADWQLELSQNHIVIDPASCETNRPGIYAIGDIATYKNKLKLILTGFSEAATAAHALYGRVFPGQALHFEYSTTKGLPAA
ncbi:MAG: NAD(P)/FAD-dependent oxidoreductase [Micavibrio sp.]|nr:MAG: NAD(P)/FAD-dependent oxidoreductase [Micavibrio sp.]